MKNMMMKMGLAAGSAMLCALVACSSGSGGNSGATVVGGAAGSNSAGSGNKAGTAGSGNKAGTAGSGNKGGGAPADCGSMASGTDTCSVCIQGSCCAEAKACDTGSDCEKVFECAQNCAEGDQACIQACLQMPGGPDAQAFAGCLNSGGPCASDCASGGGSGICDSGLTSNDEACDTCLGTTGTCCADFKACVADKTCMDCVTGKTKTGCDTNPNVPKVAACQDSCKAQCGG